MNWSDIADAMFGGIADYGAILALVSNSVIAGAVLGLSATARGRVSSKPLPSAVWVQNVWFPSVTIQISAPPYEAEFPRDIFPTRFGFRMHQ